MRTELKEEPISWVFVEHRWPSAINLSPSYQREGGIWSESRKQLLIDSMLRGWDVPKFYFRVVDDEHYEVIDGKQRLLAIDAFRGNQLKLGTDSQNLPPPFGDLNGKLYHDLSHEQKDRFNEQKLAIVKLHDAPEADVRALFLRLQEGVSLNPAEKRNASLGELRDFVGTVAGSFEGHDPHKSLSKTRYPKSRYAWDDLIAIATCLEANGGPTDVGAVSLRHLYKEHVEQSAALKKAKKGVRKTLNFMAKVLQEDTPEMKTKWGFTDLYLLISTLLNEGWVLADREADFRKFFVEFENKRLLAIKKPEALESLAASEDWKGKELFHYIEAFKTEGSKKNQVKVRHKCFIKLFLDKVNDLVPKDHQRAFNENERILLWRRAGQKCQNAECLDPELPDFNSDVHGDHIEAHSRGGLTTLKNGQCLCARCNREKGSR